MAEAGIVILAALVYLALLFAVASYGDRVKPRWMTGPGRQTIYALSLGVYCTSWTFFGSVGLASRAGFDFLTIYLGPLIMIGLCHPLLLRVVRLAKDQNITSIADFIAARYGKSQPVAAIVTIAAVIGAIPYIALQLKAIASSLQTLLEPSTVARELAATVPVLGDIAFIVAVALAAFAILFGTRHIDATEHQEGLMLAIATESVVKLAAFLTVGIYVTYVMFDGFGALLEEAGRKAVAASFLDQGADAGTWGTMVVLSFVCAILLPRQFHVMVVENTSERELRRATWLFPIYLVLINLFVVPIALAGLVTFRPGEVDQDMVVLALPLSHGASTIALVAFVGGLSAATAMVIVECVALAIMISNDLATPVILRHAGFERANMGRLLLRIRRVSIFAILLLAYLYYRIAGEAALAAIGFLAFAAIAQFAPAFFGGLFWKGATSRGAAAGMVAGLAAWAYCLLLPSLADSGVVPEALISQGPFGMEALKPIALFGLDLPRLTHGVAWSLGANVLTFLVVSLSRAPRPIERVQANAFVTPDYVAPGKGFAFWPSVVTVGELTATVSRYLGEARTARSLEAFAASRGHGIEPDREADIHMLRFAEHLLASAIGAPSSRLVLSLMLRRRNLSTEAAMQLLDDASAAIQYSRDLLQTALDNARQGVSVFDKELRLQAWNRAFRDLWDLPAEMMRVGVGLDEIIRHIASRGTYGPGNVEDLLAERLQRYVSAFEPFQTRLHPSGIVLEIRPSPMPDGGVVTTYTDITDRVQAAEALERANEGLERRVRERTDELERLNSALASAKSEADEANLSKTRFLAAASHDILQPLNAARLYATTMVERSEGSEAARLAANVDASLDAVEEILGALLDISRLDSGAMRPELTSFRIDELMRQLELEFEPLARENGLALTFVRSSATIRSDRRLLRRLLQNLVSNAIKYTPAGRVLVGCRRRGGDVVVVVADTGLGIPKSKQRMVFKEFQRLEQGVKVARGLGLGLSIVERIARVLAHEISLQSEPGRGTVFSIGVPRASAAAARLNRQQASRSDPAALDGLVVLAVDNEPKILDGMEALLTGWGCRVVKAADLPQALARCESLPPDVVLADYHLDHGDGLGVVEGLRHRHGPLLPAVLISADRSPEVREMAVAADVPVLAKPLKPAQLRALLMRLKVRREAAE
jgi:Na+/proline symporter/signal transduction histidine kinase